MTPEGRVDALIASVEPELPAPAGIRRNVVLVTGPGLAGVTSVLRVLRDLLPQHRFTERLADGEQPMAVVFVASATAPLTLADCRLLESAGAGTDLIAGVVSKVDVHRTWRDVLAANGDALAGRGDRYAHVPWVGVAASPDLGTPAVGELADLLRAALGTGDLQRRNRLRAWEAWLTELALRFDREDPTAALATLRSQRSEVLRAHRLARSGRALTLRSRVQQARVQLSGLARNHCVTLRAELQEEASAATRCHRDSFSRYVHRRVSDVVDDIDRDSARHLAAAARDLTLSAAPIQGPAPTSVDVPKTPVRSSRLESRLAGLAGCSVGLGVALTLRRLLAGLTPGWTQEIPTMAGAVVCALIGVALALWVVHVRGQLHDRAVLDRWTGEVIGCLRAAVEERVATWVLAADLVWSSAVAEEDAAGSARAGEAVAAIDRSIQDHSLARARATTGRDHWRPAIIRALAAVRTELAGF